MREGQDILRARNRSSDRTAMAFMRRTETGEWADQYISLLRGRGQRMKMLRPNGRTVDQIPEGEEHHLGCRRRRCQCDLGGLDRTRRELKPEFRQIEVDVHVRVHGPERLSPAFLG